MLEISKMTYNLSDLNLLLDSEVLSVADIIQILLEVCNSIENLKIIININNESINKINQYYLNLKNNRKPADILSEEEREKMKTDLGDASSTISKKLASEGSDIDIKGSLSPYTMIQRITQNFIDLNLLLDSDVLRVDDISTLVFELWNSIENLKNIINIHNEDISKIKQ